MTKPVVIYLSAILDASAILAASTIFFRLRVSMDHVRAFSKREMRSDVAPFVGRQKYFWTPAHFVDLMCPFRTITPLRARDQNPSNTLKTAIKAVDPELLIEYFDSKFILSESDWIGSDLRRRSGSAGCVR